MVETQKADVAMKAEEYAADAGAGESGRPGGAAPPRPGGGYRQLNALFFARHRRIIARPFHRRLFIVGGAGALLIAAALLWPDWAAAWLVRLRLSMLPLVFLMLTVGERICRAMFYNCDIGLMRYSFYRRDAARHFLLRLKRIALQNIAIGAAVCGVLTVLLVVPGAGEAAAPGLGGGFGPAGATRILMLWASGLSLSVFFSVHHLFIYY